MGKVAFDTLHLVRNVTRMIETETTRKSAQIDRESAKKYLREKFGLKTASEIVPLEKKPSPSDTPCPICEDRKRKSRERVKRYREKKLRG